MSVFQRAATFVAMTVSIALLGVSSQGSAQQIAASTPVTVVAGIAPRLMPALTDTDTNPLTPPAVPAAAASVAATFDSLADAVAAHHGDEADDAIRCLAGAIYFESKGEPLAGQLAVAEVILNRAASGRFPADVCGVVLQRGQFGFVRAGQIPTIDEDRPAYRTALAVARVALKDVWDSPAASALYFNTPGRRPASRAVKIAAVGNHVFYR